MRLSDIISLDQLNEFESKHLLNSNGFTLSIKAKRCKLEDTLYEGLISSYSISKVISTIHQSLDCQTKKLGNCFAVYGETRNFDFYKLLQILTQCGWYIAKINFLNNRKNQVSSLSKNIDLDSIEAFSKHTIYFELKVEAKFDIELDKKYWPSMMFCLAPSIVRHKIEQNGLVPKAGKNLDGQPERIYLGLDKHKLIDEMLPQLRINDSHRYQSNGAILVTIDCSKLPSNVRFFDDPNYSIDAVYSIVNIPAHCIHNIEEI